MVRGTFVALTVSVLATGVATADSPSLEAQQARIAELEARLAALEGNNWMTEQRADEIRSLVQDVLADADTRASLLSSSLSAGYNNGFTIGSADGNFNMTVNGAAQVRFVWNNQDEAAGDSDRWSFENTRTWISLAGNVGGEEWGYYIRGDFSNSGGAFFLNDAIITYDMGNGWTGIAGQFKVPVIREFVVDGTKQLAAERSNASLFSPAASRTQGIAMDYRNDQIHFVGSYNDGGGNLNTAALAFDTEVSLTARIEGLLSGSWGQFDDFTSKRGSEQGLLVGGGVHWQRTEYGTTASDLELLVVSGDVSFEGDGWNVFGSIIYDSYDFDGASPDLDRLGFVVHGGVYLNDKWEAFARYEYHDFDTTAEELSIVTVGVNAYYSPNVKMTTDVGFGTDEVSASNAITGWRTDPTGEDGQVVVRTQLQLTF